MSKDLLRLTVYLGERKRAGRRFAVDALLDRFERNAIATSIVLRGMAGFGHKHHLRTDASLSLSEDLPAVAIAVDTRARIDAVVDDALAIAGDGLVTLEQATLPADPPPTVKLSVHLGRQDRVDGRPAFVALCELLQQHGVGGASALLGVDGTVGGTRERARFLAGNAAVPMLLVAVGAGDRIAAARPAIAAAVPAAVCTEQPVWDEPDTSSAGTDLHRLTLYTAESQLHAGRPIHRAVLRELRRSGASGATTLRGVWGFHGEHPPHGDRLFTLGRHVPAVTVVVDTPDRIVTARAVVGRFTAEHGLVTVEPLLRLPRTPAPAARPRAAR